jgi:hypothetical protein
MQRISLNKLIQKSMPCRRNIAHKDSIIWFEVLLPTKKLLPPEWASTIPVADELLRFLCPDHYELKFE